MGFFKNALYFIAFGAILCMGEETAVDHDTFFAQAVEGFTLQCMERFGIVSGDSLWIHGITEGTPRMVYLFTSMVQSLRKRGIFVFRNDSVSLKCPGLWITVLDAGIRYEKIPSGFFEKKYLRRIAEIQAGCRFCRGIQTPLEAEHFWIQKLDTVLVRDLYRLEKGTFLLKNTSPPSIVSFRNVVESILAFVTIGCTIYLFYSIRSD